MEILVKKMVESRGLSIRSAAKQCGLTYSTLIDICAGNVMPRLDTLEIIARGMGCRIQDLYDSPLKSPTYRSGVSKYRKPWYYIGVTKKTWILKKEGGMYGRWKTQRKNIELIKKSKEKSEREHIQTD